MNGKDLKIILPLMVVVVIILAVLGVALMSGPKDDGKEKVTGPYEMSVGPITDAENKPIDGAIVTLQNDEGSVASEVTDEYGNAKFSFDEKVEAGEYVIVIKHDDFDQKEMNVTLDYSGKEIIFTGINTDENIELSKKLLPPLELVIGPIYNGEGMLEGVKVTLKPNNETSDINYTVYTEVNGFAKFVFDTPPADGLYTLNLSIENYTSEELEISLTYEEEEHKLESYGDITYIELEKIIPPPLPPLDFLVGPISGSEGVLEGAEVELILIDTVISTVYSDESGYAKFSFETPPEDGTYVLMISYHDHIDKEIIVMLTYNQDFHVLTVSGDITDITLEKNIPPEPVDDPEYYKQLEAYQELEDKGSPPVDVEGELDEDSDGTPEYYLEIQEETNKEVAIEEYVPLDDGGNPEYSPEIMTYEPEDPDPHLEGRGSGSRSDATGEPRSGSRNEIENLTHYDDIVDKNVILYNSTMEIMSYETEAVNPTMANEFTIEVSKVAVFINKSLAVGYINGTNATDKNNDSNPEHLVTWKAVFLVEDRNNDNKTDKKLVAVQIFEMWDNNSNGVFENSRGFMAAMVAYDNNSDGQFEDIKYGVALGHEAIIDGNITRHFKEVAVYYNHTIDKNNDSNYELHRAALYVQQYYDNNSNGYYELQREFAGGFGGVDNDSNGKWEKALLIWAGGELTDTNDDGNPNLNRSAMWMYYAEDQNEDSNLEKQAMLMILHESYDNNSDGQYDDVKEVIAGFLIIDNNSDGKPEIQDAVLAMGHEWDINKDGAMDANETYGHVFLWSDDDGDNKPEKQHALFYFAQSYDNNSNGNVELSRQLIVGYYVVDNNSDGKANEVFAVHYGVESRDRYDKGTIDHNSSFAYVLHLEDADDDENPEYKHAIFGYESKWDNNTDGKFEAINQFAAGYINVDENDDGKPDEETLFIMTNFTLDKNNDGNPELMRVGIMASHREYASNGTILLGRGVFVQTLAFDNNSNGTFEKLIMTIFGHEGINGTQNGTKVDWETQHVLIFYTVLKDQDDDGTWDANLTVFKKVEF